MATGAVVSGATLGRGGRKLARHLADRRSRKQNEIVRFGATRGLMADDVESAVMELTMLASHARSRQPLYHVHVDPELEWTPAQYRRYWQLFEREFGLEKQAFVEAIHDKHGRRHFHRVYSRVKHDGTVVRLSHDFARREKVGRTFEVEFGGRLLQGRHNKAVVAALEREGRGDVAASIRAAGLTDGPRPEAPLTPAQRHQTERTQINLVAIPEIALKAWQEVATEELVAEFASQGLRLCRGDQGPVLIDLAGGVHSLTRAIGKASATRGGRIRAAEVRQRISELKLPHLNEEGDNNERTTDGQGDRALDFPNHAGTSGRQAQERPDENAERTGQSHRRQRAEHRPRRRPSYAPKYRTIAKAIRGPAGAETRREDQFGTDFGVARSDRQINHRDPKRPVSTGRQAVRVRAAVYRIERDLDEPEFAAKLSQLDELADLLDPTRPLQRRAEELRVEALLRTEEFQPAFGRLEALMLLIFKLFAWIVGLLFGSQPSGAVGVDYVEPLDLDELSCLGPAP
jgi:hypothetical protein